MALNPLRVRRSFELSLDRARAAAAPAPAPRCPAHPDFRALKLHITHPAAVLDHRVAFRMGCPADVRALTRAGYRVEVL